MREGKIYLIEWNDANVMHGWRLDDIDDNVAKCRTVGIFKSEDDISITLKFGDSGYGTIMETITIPKVCITKIRKLRIE